MLHNRSELLKNMKEAGLDYLISSSPENFMYLTEFFSLNHWQIKGTLAFVIYPADPNKEPIMVIPQSDLDNLADSNCWIKKFKSYGKAIIEQVGDPYLEPNEERYRQLISMATNHANAFDATVEALEELGVTPSDRIAIDERCVPFTFVRQLEEKMGIRLEPGTAVFQKTRLIKTPEEVRRLKMAVGITESSVASAMDRGHIGMTEKEMLRIYYEEISKRGAVPAMNCLGCGGHSAFANVQASDKVIEQDQLIRFDIGCSYRFYHADTTLHGVYGTLPERYNRYFEAIRAGIAKGIEAMKPGAVYGDIYDIVMNDIKKTIPNIYRHHVGHGIGIEVYDPPMITPGSENIIQKDMCFCVEVPYYEYGFGGVQIEEVVHITDTGAELLSHRPVEILRRR